MTNVLLQEHLLLGALVEEDERGLDVVATYGRAQEELAAFSQGAALCDLSGMSAHIVEGDDSERFMLAACAGKALMPGEASFEAVLTGDGAIASMPLVMRTGLREFVLWDLSPRSDVLSSWIGFLSQVEGEGQPAFPNLSIEDVSDVFVPLLLCGPAAAPVVRDYLGTQELPLPGHVANLSLDRIACIVASVGTDSDACLLVLVPPMSARVLWRSFLSFPIVTPVGREALEAWAKALCPEVTEALSTTDRVQLPAKTLRSLGLVRDGGGFVGARGLA